MKTKLTKLVCGLVLAVGLAAITFTAKAAVIFDNLAAANFGGYTVASSWYMPTFFGPALMSATSEAMGFTVGGTEQSLTSVVLGIGGVSSGGGFNVALYRRHTCAMHNCLARNDQAGQSQ